MTETKKVFSLFDAAQGVPPMYEWEVGGERVANMLPGPRSKHCFVLWVKGVEGLKEVPSLEDGEKIVTRHFGEEITERSVVFLREG